MKNEPKINPTENWKAMYDSMANLHRQQNIRMGEMRLEIQRLKLELLEAKQKIHRIQSHA